MRFVHSFNTRPMAIDCYGVDSLRRLLGSVWYFALSVAYIKRAGHEIVLHTDSLGRALLGHIPYDQIHLTLDNMPEELHPRFWAAGKIWALAAEGAGVVHIDGDVFIKRRELADELADEGWDFIAQHYESSEWYEKENVLYDLAPEVCLVRGLDTHRCGAYNTGVLGFRDPALMRDFIHGYKEIAMYFSAHHSDVLDSDSFLTPDVILEQRYVHQLCSRHGARVKLVLPGASRHGAQAVAKGFQHVLTSRKFEQLDKCRAALERVAPDIYLNTLKICRNI